MKKTIVAGMLTLLALSTGPLVQPAVAATTSVTAANPDELITVHISLVNPVTGSPVYNHGLQGYWAHNEETGAYFYSDQGDNFEELPAGTYMFGAFNGYWDGASSKIVTLDGANGNYTVVTLNYWSE